MAQRAGTMRCGAQPRRWLRPAVVKGTKDCRLLGRYLPKCKLNIDAFRKLAGLCEWGLWRNPLVVTSLREPSPSFAHATIFVRLDMTKCLAKLESVNDFFGIFEEHLLVCCKHSGIIVCWYLFGALQTLAK